LNQAKKNVIERVCENRGRRASHLHHGWARLNESLLVSEAGSLLLEGGRHLKGCSAEKFAQGRFLTNASGKKGRFLMNWFLLLDN
jgi:hypothetical protein